MLTSRGRPTAARRAVACGAASGGRDSQVASRGRSANQQQQPATNLLPRLTHLTNRRFEPADVQFGTQCEGTRGEEVCFGGVARQVASINAARSAAARRGVDTLVLHACDQYTGTLYDAVFTKKGQQIAADFLTLMGVQAFTLGNHEVGLLKNSFYFAI